MQIDWIRLLDAGRLELAHCDVDTRGKSLFMCLDRAARELAEGPGLDVSSATLRIIRITGIS